MICEIKGPAQQRYVLRMGVAAGLCMLFALVAATDFRLGRPAGIIAYLTAVLPGIPILWSLFETGVYLNSETDEFQRNLLVQAILGGIGLTLAITTIWGNLEDFTHVPHLRLILIYPIFWFAAVISYFVVSLRYR